MADRHGFFAELKRRNVWRAAALYAGAAWALSQGVAQLGPAFSMPEWGTRWFVVACIIGFPFWLVFAWFYELTPHGFKRDSEVLHSAPAQRTNTRRLDVGIICVLGVAVALLASGYFIPRGTPAGSVPAKSIAVLPFENLSADKNNDYFVAGMQDLILTKLAGVGNLKVIARTSTMQYKSHPDDLKKVGEQLGVATILEGSVQKQGNEVLINVQLINARTDSHIWAQSYTRTLDNIFGVEGEVAEKIASALSAKLSPAQTARLAIAPTTNEAAYDLFLRAEYQWNRSQDAYDTANLKAAIPLYRQAVAKDPNFALAWARLSLAESYLGWFRGSGADVAHLYQQARADGERALQLQPGLAAAHLAMGYYDYMNSGDRAGALKAFAVALRLKPNDADALTARGFVERRDGRFDDALASLQEAVALDPRNVVLTAEVGATQMMLGRYADAETWFRRTQALDPDDAGDRVTYGHAILLGTGDVPRALQAVQGDAPSLKIARAELLTLQRKYKEALQLLDGTPNVPASLNPGDTVPKALLQANLYRLLGDTARARPLFEQGLAAAGAQLAMGHGVNLAFVWRNRADAELGLGQTRQAMDDIAKALAIIDQNGDQFYGPLVEYACAALYAQAGRADLAAPLLAKALAEPGSHFLYSPVLLWLGPAWDPIRKDPRFEALLVRYAKSKPPVTYDPAPAPTTLAAREPAGGRR